VSTHKSFVAGADGAVVPTVIFKETGLNCASDPVIPDDAETTDADIVANEPFHLAVEVPNDSAASESGRIVVGSINATLVPCAYKFTLVVLLPINPTVPPPTSSASVWLPDCKYNPPLPVGETS